MNSRRDFLKAGVAGSLAFGLHQLPSARAFGISGPSQPTRFIFMHKGNGLFPEAVVPPSFNKELKEKERRKESFVEDLDGHDLPEWMNPVAAHRNDLTILQGLSGKMCTTGHHTWCSSLGAYKANERISSIKWATVDFELANLFPSPFGHIELACFPSGGGNSRGNINGIEKGFSARGPQQPNHAFGSPRVAMQELFKSVATADDAKVQYQLERQMLDFVAKNQGQLAKQLRGVEQPKIANYASSVEALRARNRDVEAMGDILRQHIPQLDQKYLAEDISTVDRQSGFTEILLSTLISGMTNVVTFTVDELGTIYTGLPGIEGINVNQHDVGHGKPAGPLEAVQVRTNIRQQHMQLVDTIVNRLKSVPEGNGTMFDNTMLFYFPDNGETHHSHGTEWPFLVFSGANSRLDIGRRYIRLPGYNKEGHKTLGNWYTTILNAYGNSIDHYGAPDVGLTIDQKGPIESFLA